MAVNSEIDDLAASLEQEASTQHKNEKEKTVKPQSQKEHKEVSKKKELPPYVILRATFSTYVPVVGHPEVKTSREFPAGQLIEDPRDIQFLITNRALLEYPKDYVV